MIQGGVSVQAGLRHANWQHEADVSRQVTARLDAESPITLALPEGYGEMQTARILADAALAAAARGRRVVWSTRTTPRRRAAMALLQRALPDLPPSARLVNRFSLADYISPTRTRRLRRALAARGASPNILASLDRIAARGGLLADVEQNEAGLPAPISLLCLTAACPRAELTAKELRCAMAFDGGIIVQSHITTLREARLGRLGADLVLLDEADALASIAAAIGELRLPLADIEALARRAGAEINAPLASLKARASERIVWCDGEMANTIRAVALAIRPRASSLSHHEPGIAEAMADMAATLVDVARLAESAGKDEADALGAALVHEAGPTLTVARLNPAKWLGPTLADRQVVLAALGDGLAMTGAGSGLGFATIEPVAGAHPAIASPSIHLAGRGTELPFTSVDDEELEERPEPGFYDTAFRMVSAARENGGRTLVLCGGFGDVEQMEFRLGSQALLHRRGEDLSRLLVRFAAAEDSVLVTPAGWTGLAFEGEVTNLVLLRLPLGHRDRLREEVVRQGLGRRALTAHDVERWLEREARSAVSWRVAQSFTLALKNGFGAGALWIADPRFPLPAGMVVEVWRGLTQGHATAWQDLAGALPRCLRIPSGRSAYDRAQVFKLAP